MDETRSFPPFGAGASRPPPSSRRYAGERVERRVKSEVPRYVVSRQPTNRTTRDVERTHPLSSALSPRVPGEGLGASPAAPTQSLRAARAAGSVGVAARVPA